MYTKGIVKLPLDNTNKSPFNWITDHNKGYFLFHIKETNLWTHSMIQTVHHIVQQVDIQFLVEVQQLLCCMVC